MNEHAANPPAETKHGSLSITKSISLPSRGQDYPKELAEGNKDENDLSRTDRVWTSLIAGATAGALAKTTIAPLDRTKINFQTTNQPYSAKAALKFLVHSYRKDGLVSLWRGNSATMVRIIPHAAIQFTVHEQWKIILRVNGPQTNPERRFLAGALAGTTSQCMTYPLDLARAQMAVTEKTEYRTLRQVFIKIYRTEGIAGYYRGFTPTVLGVIPYAGCSFFFYETLKHKFALYTANSPSLAAVSGLVSGAIAGIIGQTSSYPLDVIRRRMQTSALKQQSHLGVLATSSKIFAEEGIMSFYKGLSMNWVKGPVAVGISFVTYGIVRDFLREVIT